MELHVVSTEGIPEGCVLSVRAGATRRQAPVAADRPFRFPTLPQEALPFKVDVLEPVASARLILRPGEERRTDCQYTIPLEGVGAEDKAAEQGAADDSMNVTIAVRPTEEAEKAAAKVAESKEEGDAVTRKKSGGSSASSRHGQASAAREYLDQHNLVEFTQLLVQSVIKEQPDKPYAFMARQFYFPDPKPRPNTSPTVNTGKADHVLPSAVDEPPATGDVKKTAAAPDKAAEKA
mmetsp:Transcript_78263/g.135794  ORF Transcript_78263/g.135794 Transcript_78263/m.135794 type:complete len:235 (+) Transcript_78263:93-797(+)